MYAVCTPLCPPLGHYQLALRARLGVALPELMPRDEAGGSTPVCGGCGEHHDSYGFHPSCCRSGNREGLWTQRHDVVEDMLMYVMRRLGQSPIRVSRGARNWFGAAAMRPDGSFRLGPDQNFRKFFRK